MLTARDSTRDKVLGMDSGADDYLVKSSRASSRRTALTPALPFPSGSALRTSVPGVEPPAFTTVRRP
jgi:PleD family two-component response regulator